jgi:hypothetical protein
MPDEKTLMVKGRERRDTLCPWLWKKQGKHFCPSSAILSHLQGMDMSYRFK